MNARRSALLEAGESILFIDRKEREYLKVLRPGARFLIRGGKIEYDAVIGLPEGSRVASSLNESFLVLRPTYAQLVRNLPRNAQVIYPKDTGLILLWGDVFPGATVVESGVGPGALSMALLRAIGEGGRLVSYENREDFAEMARTNVGRFLGDAPQWTLRVGDVYEGIAETDVDRVVLDLPEPWRVVDHAARALRPGGVFVAYVPTVLQVKSVVDELQRHPSFGVIETFESWMRFWHVRAISIRPEHRMVAHTGFLTVARRLG
ncbi:MAG: tRNA (adenine-N1)-methyltransferase [Candidatus Binatia bacterium]